MINFQKKNLIILFSVFFAFFVLPGGVFSMGFPSWEIEGTTGGIKNAKLPNGSGREIYVGGGGLQPGYFSPENQTNEVVSILEKDGYVYVVSNIMAYDPNIWARRPHWMVEKRDAKTGKFIAQFDYWQNSPIKGKITSAIFHDEMQVSYTTGEKTYIPWLTVFGYEEVEGGTIWRGRAISPVTGLVMEEFKPADISKELGTRVFSLDEEPYNRKQDYNINGTFTTYELPKRIYIGIVKWGIEAGYKQLYYVVGLGWQGTAYLKTSNNANFIPKQMFVEKTATFNEASALGIRFNIYYGGTIYPVAPSTVYYASVQKWEVPANGLASFYKSEILPANTQGTFASADMESSSGNIYIAYVTNADSKLRIDKRKISDGTGTTILSRRGTYRVDSTMWSTNFIKLYDGFLYWGGVYYPGDAPWRDYSWGFLEKLDKDSGRSISAYVKDSGGGTSCLTAYGVYDCLGVGGEGFKSILNTPDGFYIGGSRNGRWQLDYVKNKVEFGEVIRARHFSNLRASIVYMDRYVINELEFLKSITAWKNASSRNYFSAGSLVKVSDINHLIQKTLASVKPDIPLIELTADSPISAKTLNDINTAYQGSYKLAFVGTWVNKVSIDYTQRDPDNNWGTKQIVDFGITQSNVDGIRVRGGVDDGGYCYAFWGTGHVITVNRGYFPSGDDGTRQGSDSEGSTGSALYGSAGSGCPDLAVNANDSGTIYGCFYNRGAGNFDTVELRKPLPLGTIVHVRARHTIGPGSDSVRCYVDLYYK